MQAIDKELLARLPRTFVPALNEKLRNWDLLFPAEQRLLAAHIDWLGKLPGEEFDKLFSPIKAIEAKMDLPKWSVDSSGMSIGETALLARSPHYPEWRAEVEKAFERIDSAVESRLLQFPRLVVCLLPAGVSPPAAGLWPYVGQKGQWRRLTSPFGRNVETLTSALSRRSLPSGVEHVEGSWALEYGVSLTRAQAAGWQVLSWEELEPVRARFLSRLNVIRKDLHSADETHRELRRTDISRIGGPGLSTPRTREFVRELLLSGNGALVFGNSFVQWGASETLRRVQPQVLLAAFGIRNKPKPFSSIVMFEDQKRANPVPDEKDLAGSLLDTELLAEYVHLAAQRLAPYHERTVTLMGTAEMDRVLVLAPKHAPALPAGDEVISPQELAAFALEWLGTTA